MLFRSYIFSFFRVAKKLSILALSKQCPVPLKLLSLIHISQNGKFLCRVEGETSGNVLLRREQYRIADDRTRSLAIAKNMVGAKTANSRAVLSRFLRDHPMSADSERIKSAADYLGDSLEKIRAAGDADELRGFEGVNASCYFSVFDEMILQNRSVFRFGTRVKLSLIHI